MERMAAMKRRIKRILIGAACSIFLTSTIYAMEEEAESRRFSVLQTEGREVFLTRENGSKSRAVAGMRLSQGNRASTGERSSIYIEADRDTILKLDEHTLVEITKASEKALKLTLKQGELFFNVDTALAEDEELIFQAAHTSMSVRGTSGVFYLTPEKLIFYLIEGAVNWDLGTGETVSMTAGQVLELQRDWGGKAPGPGIEALYRLVRLEPFTWEELTDAGLEAVMENQEQLDLTYIGLDTEEELSAAGEQVRELEELRRELEERLLISEDDDDDSDIEEEEDIEEDPDISTPSDAEQAEQIEYETGEWFSVRDEETGEYVPTYWVYYEEGVNGEWSRDGDVLYWHFYEEFIMEMEEQGYLLG